MQRWLNEKEITQSNIGTNFRIRYRMCMRQKQPDKRSIRVTVLQVCEFRALTVRKRSACRQKSYCENNFPRLFACKSECSKLLNSHEFYRNRSAAHVVTPLYTSRASTL